MKNRKTILVCFFLASLVLVMVSGCGALGRIEVPIDPEIKETSPTVEDIPLEMVEIGEQQIRQWAVEAEASSEYANPEWSAMQATGAPDTESCGDYQTAWASAESDSISTLVLRFPVAVHVTQVNIIETFNPNQVRVVELLGSFERNIVIYDKSPSPVDQPCPYTLSIPVEPTEERYDAIRIKLDQSELGLGWNQIDAVELIGIEK